MSVQQDQDTTRAGARGLKALQTFQLPSLVEGSEADKALGRALVAAWQADGIFQVQATGEQQAATERALNASRAFFRRPLYEKAAHVSDLTYSGYVASGEEETAGEKDGSEIFTVCPDIAANDARVIEQWPCHGPVPWPSADYAGAMKDYMRVVGDVGHRLLQLTALGLGLDDMEHFTRLTEDGWHHMRVLRFPAADVTSERGIGSHTDYGLLVIAAQDDVGGLYIRPPVAGEERGRNWLPGESMAGRYENEEPWTFVTPVPAVFTVFPRSEEHTSELQSLAYLVCRLLLEKKKKIQLPHSFEKKKKKQNQQKEK